ncbi:MAG: ATP-dependent Clp protease proteolytic subunit [Oscillospiraceae bacterium]|nr:ATP-dependent Clp protease proteolytic subunit [Oscillospiraceae bacterium]
MSEQNITPCIVRETARGIEYVRIEDELYLTREIFLTDRVSSATMNSLLKQIMYLSRKAPEEEITIYINSPGGDVPSGLAIYDLLHMTKTPIRTVCVGKAASMAAILFLAGDKREMLPHSQIMIHDPSLNASLQGMKPAEMSRELSSLKKVQKILCEAICEATGKSMQSVRSKTKKDSFFDADEAIAYGLATAIIEEV